MAKNFTSASGFTFQPTQTSIADFNVQQEQLDAGRREEKLKQEQFQYLKDTREREWTDKFMQNIKESIKPIQVDNADIQSFVIAGSMKAMEEIALLSDKVRNNTATPKERAKIATLLNTSDNYKALIGPYTKTIESLNNGSVHKDDGLINYLSNFSNAEPEFDEKGLPIIRIKDANGKVREINFNEQLKGIEGFKLIPNLDPYKGFAEFTKDIKPEEIESYDGYETTKKKGISTQLATQLAETFLYPSNIMSNHLKSALKKAGFDPFNLTADAANYAIKLKDELAQQLINSNERFDKTEYNWSAQNSANSLAETKRHNRVSEAISQQNANTSAFNAQTSRMKEGANGITLGELTIPDNTSMSVATKTFGPLHNYRSVVGGKLEPGTLKDSKGTVYEDPVVLGYTYDKKTNSLILDIEYNEGTERMDNDGNVIKGKKNRTAIKVGKATESRVASLLSGNSESLRKSIISEDTKPKIDY